MTTKTVRKNNFRLGMSPIDGSVFIGRARITGNIMEMTGIKHDVTQDFYGVLLQKASMDDGRDEGGFYITANGENAYDVTIKRVRAP